jgi:hypothetical protein
LTGGGGVDTFSGGPGDDTLEDEGDGEADVFAGGAGKDTISYAGRPTGISLTVGTGLFENDRLDSVESVIGTEARDVLVGDAGSNSLYGDLGDDRIDAGGGADLLDGDAGRDWLRGGPGDDALLLGEDGAADSIRCGSGRDTVHETDASDLVPADCERVELDEFVVVGAPKRFGRSKVRVRYFIPRYGSVPEATRFKLYKRGKSLGKSGMVRRRSGRATIRLNRAGRRILRRSARVVLGETEMGYKYATKVR